MAVNRKNTFSSGPSLLSISVTRHSSHEILSRFERWTLTLLWLPSAFSAFYNYAPLLIFQYKAMLTQHEAGIESLLASILAAAVRFEATFLLRGGLQPLSRSKGFPSRTLSRAGWTGRHSRRKKSIEVKGCIHRKASVISSVHSVPGQVHRYISLRVRS